MDRIIAADSVDQAHADLAPATGTPQFATDGDPVGAVPATEWPAYQYNAIQEEILAVVAASGAAFNRNDNTQLLAAIRELVQLETGNYAPDTGAANAYVIAPTPPIEAYTQGLTMRFRALHANTGASTISVSGLPAKALVRDDGTPLVAGDIPLSGIANVIYIAEADSFFLISTVQADASVAQAQAGNYAADTGADGTHYACTLAPALGTHKPGMPIRIKAAHTNTGASTFNPGPGAVAIQDMRGNALTAGAIVANAIIELKYDGAVYQLVGALIATAAEIKAFVDNEKAVTPKGLLSAPGAAKGGVKFTIAGGVLTVVQSLKCGMVRTGAGTYTVTLSADIDMFFGFAIFQAGGTNVAGLVESAGPYVPNGTYNFQSVTLANTVTDCADGLILFF